MQRPKKTMRWPVYEKAVREFSAAGGGSLNFTPTVGDPLVDKRLIDKIEFAKSFANISQIFLYTNGILLNRFDMDRFLKSGLTRLAISTFIGSREGYKHYYGKDKYDQVVTNIYQHGRTQPGAWLTGQDNPSPSCRGRQAGAGMIRMPIRRWPSWSAR